MSADRLAIADADPAAGARSIPQWVLAKPAAPPAVEFKAGVRTRCSLSNGAAVGKEWSLQGEHVENDAGDVVAEWEE